MEESYHVPVMVEEVLQALDASAGGDFLDCTLGGAGHTRAILEANPKNKVTAIDRDKDAVSRAEHLLNEFSERVTLLHASFSGLAKALCGENFNGILADLGISSDQLLPGRGFSFEDDSSFDMRMDTSKGMTAAEFINTTEESELRKALFEGGVGKEANFVSKVIIDNRPYKTAKDLARHVNKALQGKLPSKKKNPSTVIFQAIRMAVNEELKELKSLLDAVPALIKSGGTFAVITFHSLEDRAAARVLRSWEGGEYSALWPGESRGEVLGELLPRSAIKPGKAEVEANPRARSARLRVFKFKG